MQARHLLAEGMNILVPLLVPQLRKLPNREVPWRSPYLPSAWWRRMNELCRPQSCALNSYWMIPFLCEISRYSPTPPIIHNPLGHYQKSRCPRHSLHLSLPCYSSREGLASLNMSLLLPYLPEFRAWSGVYILMPPCQLATISPPSSFKNPAPQRHQTITHQSSLLHPCTFLSNFYLSHS